MEHPYSLEKIQSSNQQGCLLYTAAVEPTMETPEHCNDITNHASEEGGHLRMDCAVRVVPDFLDHSFDGAGCLLDSDPSPVLGRVDFLKVKQVHSKLINKKKSKLPQFTSVAADFLVAQPGRGGAGHTSVTSKLHCSAASISNNGINRDPAKLYKNKCTNINPSNGILDSLTIFAPSPQLPSDNEAMGDLGEDVEPSNIVNLEQSLQGGISMDDLTPSGPAHLASL